MGCFARHSGQRSAGWQGLRPEAFAPERANPGDPASASKGVPRLVGATTKKAGQRAAALLHKINDEVVELSSPDAAELAKLLENVFRNVNIALVNQLALLCERMGLDVWEIIDAAATKPFGFMKFTPGPGVGGHCIPVDPYYLSWRAREFDFVDRFIELAGDINLAMPRHVVDLTAEALNDRGRALKGAKVGILGVAFKPNIRDARNSPAADVIAAIAARGAEVRFHDPHVPSFRDSSGEVRPETPLAELLAWADVVVVVTAHTAIDWKRVYADADLILDTVDSSRDWSTRPRQVLRLGAGWSIRSSNRVTRDRDRQRSHTHVVEGCRAHHQIGLSTYCTVTFFSSIRPCWLTVAVRPTSDGPADCSVGTRGLMRALGGLVRGGTDRWLDRRPRGRPSGNVTDADRAIAPGGSDDDDRGVPRRDRLGAEADIRYRRPTRDGRPLAARAAPADHRCLRDRRLDLPGPRPASRRSPWRRHARPVPADRASPVGRPAR